MQLLHLLLQGEDLVHGEHVLDALVPVRPAQVGRVRGPVEGEPLDSTIDSQFSRAWRSAPRVMRVPPPRRGRRPRPRRRRRPPRAAGPLSRRRTSAAEAAALDRAAGAGGRSWRRTAGSWCPRRPGRRPAAPVVPAVRAPRRGVVGSVVIVVAVAVVDHPVPHRRRPCRSAPRSRRRPPGRGSGRRRPTTSAESAVTVPSFDHLRREPRWRRGPAAGDVRLVIELLSSRTTLEYRVSCSPRCDRYGDAPPEPPQPSNRGRFSGLAGGNRHTVTNVNRADRPSPRILTAPEGERPTSPSSSAGSGRRGSRWRLAACGSPDRGGAGRALPEEERPAAVGRPRLERARRRTARRASLADRTARGHPARRSRA